MDVQAITIYISAIAMWYDVSRTVAPQSPASLSLGTVYEVRADPGYHVDYTWPPTNLFIAVRTLSGYGQLEAKDSGPVPLTAGTLLIVSRDAIRRFHCHGKSWHFWWFEFSSIGNLLLPAQQLLRLDVMRSEVPWMKACFADLRHNAPGFRARASSRFTLLMHDWAARWSGEATPQTRHQEAIQRVVQLMHSSLDAHLGLPEMARAAGLGERRFREVFTELTGKSPKRFYEELKLRKAADHLRFQAGNVSEVADAFGYSSPFHFSKAFRKFFGEPPRCYLGRRS